MSDIDIHAKECLSEAEVFADAFNYFIYDGEQVIDPERLRPVDTEVIGVPYGSDDSGSPVQRYRDVLKSLTAMEDDSQIYLLLGIEAQANDNYAMPVRSMVYDALQYAKQVEEAAKSHRRNRPDRTVSSGEYLSGFYKDDRLVPVITLVIYLSPDEWKGPRSLREMLLTNDPRILRFVPDYPINLLCPAEKSEEELNVMQTELREIFLYLKYSRDRKRLEEIIRKYDGFRSLDLKAARLINAVTGSGLKLDESKEEIDMCQAIMEMRHEERQEGIKEGIKEGITEGEYQKARRMVMGLLKNGALSIDVIADIAEMPVSEVEAIRAEMEA